MPFLLSACGAESRMYFFEIFHAFRIGDGDLEYGLRQRGVGFCSMNVKQAMVIHEPRDLSRNACLEKSKFLSQELAKTCRYTEG